MPATFRFALYLVLSASLAFAAVPREPPVQKTQKTDCCAKKAADSAAHDCNRHAPKPVPDRQCCVYCASCVTGVLAAATAFVYPPIGDETFAAYISSEQTRSQRPPVPPPRT